MNPKYKIYNQYFSISDHIGSTAITEMEFQVLMADGKVFTTKCRMTGVEASKAIELHVSEFEVEERTYGGQIVADSLKESEQIAKERGFGEEVEGCLCGIISSDHDMINPCNTDNNRN